MQSPYTWASLPAELHISVVDYLDVRTTLSLSQVSRSSRVLCVPRLFFSVNISSFTSLMDYLAVMPPAYGYHMRQLDVCTSSAPTHELPSSCRSASNQSRASASHWDAFGVDGTPRTDALIRLLARTPHLERLTLRLSGGLASKSVTSFRALRRLTHLTIENCDDEDVAPLSERVVVGIALSLPNLTSLSLSRITRSLQYADDIYSTNTFCSHPVIVNDHPLTPADPNPPHCLSSLLTIPSLRHLAVHDTHLGDPRFTSDELPVRCRLETLEIGAYAHASPAETAEWTARILARVGAHLSHIALGAGLPAGPDHVCLLPDLKTVRLAPFMSPTQIPSTLASVLAAGAPVERLEVDCVHDDLEDVADELVAFFAGVADETCPIADIRIHVKDDDMLDGPTSLLLPAEPLTLSDECTRGVRRLDTACGRTGTQVTLLGAVLAAGDDVSASEDDTQAGWASDDTVVDDRPTDGFEKDVLRSWAMVDAVNGVEWIEVACP